MIDTVKIAQFEPQVFVPPGADSPAQFRFQHQGLPLLKSLRKLRSQICELAKKPDYILSNLSSEAGPQSIVVDNVHADQTEKRILLGLLAKLRLSATPDSIKSFHIDNTTGIVSIGDGITQLNLGQFPVQDISFKARFFDPTTLKLSREVDSLDTQETELLTRLIKKHFKKNSKESRNGEGAVMGFVNEPGCTSPVDRLKTLQHDSLARKLGQALVYHANAA